MMSQFKKYRKKPIVVEAYQLTSEMKIPTLEGEMTGNPGDYLVKGVEGELYPCKEKIFKKTYVDVTKAEPTRIEILEAALNGAIEECKTLMTLWVDMGKKKNDPGVQLHKMLIERFEAALKDKL